MNEYGRIPSNRMEKLKQLLEKYELSQFLDAIATQKIELSGVELNDCDELFKAINVENFAEKTRFKKLLKESCNAQFSRAVFF